MTTQAPDATPTPQPWESEELSVRESLHRLGSHVVVNTAVTTTTQGFIELTPSGTAGTGVALINNATGPSVTARLLASNDASFAQSAINENWHVIGATFTSTHVKLYVDGVLKATIAGTYSLGTCADISIGCLNYTTPANFLTGGICEAAIWSADIADAGMANFYSYCKDRYALIY